MIQTKARPILFSAPMVRAILEGRKTQTRRVVKPQPTVNFIPSVGPFHPACIDSKTGECFPGELTYGASDEYEGFTSPYGHPGDRLWVRETHIPKASGTIYRADFEPMEAAGLGGLYGGWKPSIFMRREFSRITLEIGAVRVERLQDISDADALAEGVQPKADANIAALVAGSPETAARMEYYALWESINGAGSWAKNPWVFVIEFKRL